jgi:hypothetical protein
VNGILHATVTLPREKSSYYPLDGKVCGPQSLCGCCGEEKYLALPGIEPGLSSPWLSQLLSIQVVTIFLKKYIYFMLLIFGTFFPYSILIKVN